MNETRFVGPVEIRAVGDDYELTGTVMKYADRANFGRWEERFEPGALKPADDGVVLNQQHDRRAALARSPDTLTLKDGPEAMRMTAKLPATALAGDVVALVRSKVLRGLSVEFHAKREQWAGRTRIIKEAVLTGLAVVDRAQYGAADVEARAADLEQRWQAAHRPVRGGWRPGL